MKKKAVIYATGERGVYVGRLEKHFKRTNVPSTLLVSLEDELEVFDSTRQNRVVAKSFLIPAGMSLEVETHGAHVAMFFLGGSQDLLRLTELASAEQLVNEWMNHPSRLKPDPDPRITRAIQLIRQSHDQNVSVEWIGRQVGLSASRLSQLFKEEVGTPIRRYRLWHRVFVTVARIKEGAGLTEAALAAGFADYAQFSHTYRQLAGGSPSEARDNTEILVRDY